MRIALDDIDPHIADQYRVMAPVRVSQLPALRRQKARLSRRRRMALAAALVVPPMVGFQLATWFTDKTHYTNGWLPWVIWFGTWAVGTGIGCRATLKGRLNSRASTALMAIHALAAPVLGFGVAVSAFIGMGGPGVPMGFWLLWGAISLFAAFAISYPVTNFMPKSSVTTDLQPETMRDVFNSLSLTRAERVYCDVLLFLARANPNTLTELTMRETLRQLNDLLQSSRQLEEQRLSLLPLLGANVVPELRAEYDQLKLRLNNASDSITRASLEQSLRMIVSRIEDAHNLQTGLERLNTQQEAITQTLSSALSGLGRMQIAPDVRTDTNAEFAMNDISDTVTQMNQQSHAVESAVEEVLTLRSSG